MKEFSKFVFIGEYDSFYDFDIVIDGHSVNVEQRKSILRKISITDFTDYGKLFQILFPGKIVVYNCNGQYWYYKDGSEFQF